ncbi:MULTISPECIES: Holliday junction branch migration protein RuvA [Helicobacter]|uniref:Holliday junction branch migration complex subunit RuvA n=4 Tax=Helicobacter typhlonius TaxID=76936 RepID=A0A0S4PTT6_9HELI|nr:MULTISPECIES: Holliday junction branch migration protein RuvA [Helicobacter]CUU39354.1 Holliday junction DNA helicase RuvA [Helicobacter typhlonius]
MSMNLIIGLRGITRKIEPMFVELDVGGVIYGVQMSLNATTSLKSQVDSQSHSEVRILCTHIIREDAHLLFGFIEDMERQTFERLIKINGVGPKVALAILSTYTPTHFATIIANKDIDALKKVPGIGPKSAGKIMVDVAGFFAELLQNQNMEPQNNLAKEASLALKSLGFKEGEIAKALRGIEATNVSELVKEALKRLS